MMSLRFWLFAACAITGACSLTTGLSGFSSGASDAFVDGSDSASTSDGSSPTSEAGPDVITTPLHGWQFRKPLTIDKASVSSPSDLVAFPLLIRRTDPDLKTVEHGGKLVTGTDIAFFADDAVTPLAFEIERYSASTGELIAWVKVPVLSPATGAKLFVYFGNSEVTSSLENRSAVWSDGYVGVWHMGDTTWTDSAGANTGSPTGGVSGAPTGMIGAGVSIGASASNLDVGTDPALRPTSITVSAWAQSQSVASAPDTWRFMVAQDIYRDPGDNPRGFYMELHRTQSNRRPAFYTANWSNVAMAYATTELVNDRWYHVVGTRDSASGVTRIYVDGEEEGSATMTGSIAYLDNPPRIGGTGTNCWGGLLDEVRISSMARSPGWIRTEHSNQRSPQEFVSVGNLEAIP